MKAKVFIGVPCVDGKIRVELASVLMEWSKKYNAEIFYGVGLKPHCSARNKIVEQFLKTDSTHLLFIDSDIVPPLDSLKKLLSADRHIIAPLCFCWKPGDDGIPFPCPVSHRKDERGNYRPYVGEGTEETDVITGGMFLVKREVFEKIERPFEFTFHRSGIACYSEDFRFSQKAKERGFHVWTDFSILCGHYKTLNILDVNNLMVRYGKAN